MPEKLPQVNDYTEGGGSILTPYTTVRNVVSESPIHLVDEIFQLLRSGYEVLIADDKIKALTPPKESK